MRKIFNLGLPKTGTTSFHSLMNEVGLKSVHDQGYQDGIDSFSGTISTQYKTLYERFPDARYVLTLRDNSDWLQSTKIHYSTGHIGKVNLRKQLFGTEYVSSLSDDELLKIYNDWNNKIRNFFIDKDNFMEINFINYVGNTKHLCEKLLKFLNIDTDIIKLDFPHKNKGLDADILRINV